MMRVANAQKQKSTSYTFAFLPPHTEKKRKNKYFKPKNINNLTT